MQDPLEYMEWVAATRKREGSPGRSRENSSRRLDARDFALNNTKTYEGENLLGGSEMICPLKFNSNTIDADGNLQENQCQCEREDCELWEANTGTCSLHTLAYLKGREVARRE